jgi:site-specific DNA recombinase
VQRDACLKWASEHGKTVSPEHIFVDDGVSGAKENRPALNSLNRAVQDGIISTVIVYKLDRLARSPYVAYKLAEKDWHKKAALVSVSEAHIDTTSTTGQLGFGIAAVFASHERNTIRDRTMSGKRRRATEGRNPGLRPPYGYQLILKSFVIVEEEAAILRRMYAEYLTGRTDGQIARALNDAGIKTKAGGPWHISAIQRVLQNPAYKGTLMYRDIAVDGAFPVIIDAQSWEQAQTIRSQKAKTHPRRLSAESPYILSGRLVCSKCGRPMNGRVCRNGKYENRYYACTGYIQFRDCDCLTVRQDKLEEAVVANLLPLLDEAELNRRIRERAGTRLDGLRDEVATLETHLRELDQQLSRVRQDYRQAKIDADTFNELRGEIEADKATVVMSLNDNKSELIRVEAASRVGEDVRQAVNLLRAWKGLSYTQRRQVIHLLTERIVWDYDSQQVTVRTVV